MTQIIPRLPRSLWEMLSSCLAGTSGKNCKVVARSIKCGLSELELNNNNKLNNKNSNRSFVGEKTKSRLEVDQRVDEVF